jgi:putative selenium metabolism protein SsnA
MTDATLKSTRNRVFKASCLYDGMGRLFRDAELYICDGVVCGVKGASETDAESVELRQKFAQAEQIVIADGFLLPGLINSHHHFYSSLARGIALGEPATDFSGILKQLWWKLDRSLDLEDVRVSAQVAMLDGLRHGCTQIIDHHSSPSAVRGSLEAIAREARALNLTTALCYEISDRNGEAVFDDSLAENLEFFAKHSSNPLCRGMLGLHASFTLSDASLKKIAQAKPVDLPIHVHAAEDLCDMHHAESLGFSGPLARLHAYGLCDSRSLIAHGVHLSKSELELAASTGLWIAHNPESNCNNRVGYADASKFRADRILLGTDGMNSDMLSSLRFAYFLHSGLSAAPAESLELFERMLFRNPAEYLSELFGYRIGTIHAGDAADFAVFPYSTPTAITAENYRVHMVYALTNNALASWVYANGVPMIEDHQFVGVDEHDIYAAARESARRVWSRFQHIQD